jgi:hypothetical protein
MLLNIEARIGELYEALPSRKGERNLPHKAGKVEAIEDSGISNQRANRASVIHRNPAAVAESLTTAGQRGLFRVLWPSRRHAARAIEVCQRRW